MLGASMGGPAHQSAKLAGGAAIFEHRTSASVGAMQLQLQVAMDTLAEVLNHSDDALRVKAIRELEQRTGLTVRTPEQEATLRAFARLADCEADKGIAEVVSLEDADLWYASRFMELREQARIPLRQDEIMDFLSRA